MDPENSFIVPPPQSHIGDYSFASVIKYGSSQDFTWTSNYGIPFNLALVQETAFLDNNEGPVHIDYLATNITTSSYSWDGEPDQNLTLSNLFWLGMYNASDNKSGPLFKSQYFNVTTTASSSSSSTSTSSSSSSSTVSTSSASPLTSSSSLPAVQPITTPTSTASATPSSTPKSTASDVALGAGLGAGLGGAALIFAVALFFFLGRKRQRKGVKTVRPEVYHLAENDTFSR